MKKKQTILIVDDERDILDLLVFNARQEGYETIAVTNGEEAITTARKLKPDLIILDLMLPGLDGLDVSRILNNDEATKDIPIIMLTAKGTEEDVVKGFDLGADDYVTKPFSPKVLFARVKNVLRRKVETKETNDKTNDEIINFREIEINTKKRTVKVNGKEVNLTFSEFEILAFLIKHTGWAFSRSEIVNNIHGENYFVTDRAVDVQIVGLRKKLGTAAKYIETVRGIGYKLRDD